MSQRQHHFVRLTKPLFGLTASLLLGVALALWSHNQAEEAEQARDACRKSKNQIELRLHQAAAEKNELGGRASLYQELRSTGIAGKDNRFIWTEILDSIAKAFQVRDIHYEFAPRIPLDKTSGNAWPYFSSTLHLQFTPLHEADFLTILADIQRQAPALVLLRSCHLSKTQSLEEGAIRPLHADCEMQWLTTQPDRREQ
ncbi:hypothetical protein [Quatrionicoccus australiensis]|uniref:hypothetical protein n=1 Tax=Quatrionicoccus australiensis TaxID=138118 RepID=UPI001CFB5205|nr:hypothetical protein [Quatrionicoccus australiensis]MCB4360762.1 hypothetical protein [Quatrionicoccus australiensis]